MAEKLDTFPDDGRERKYPWDEWLDGSTWKLVKGEDFQGNIPSMISMAYQAAKSRGQKVRTHQGIPNAVVIQAYKEEESA